MREATDGEVLAVIATALLLVEAGFRLVSL